MPLVKSSSKAAFRKNIKAEVKAGKPVKMETFMKPNVTYAIGILMDILDQLNGRRDFCGHTMACKLAGGRIGLVKLGQNPIGPMDFGILRLTD